MGAKFRGILPISMLSLKKKNASSVLSAVVVSLPVPDAVLDTTTCSRSSRSHTDLVRASAIGARKNIAKDWEKGAKTKRFGDEG